MCAYVFCIRNGNTVAIILFCSFFFFRTLFPKPLFLPSLLPLMPSLWHGTAPSHTFSISFYNNSEKWDIQAIHSIIKLYWNVHWIRWKKKNSHGNSIWFECTSSKWKVYIIFPHFIILKFQTSYKLLLLPHCVTDNNKWNTHIPGEYCTGCSKFKRPILKFNKSNEKETNYYSLNGWLWPTCEKGRYLSMEN